MADNRLESLIARLENVAVNESLLNRLEKVVNTLEGAGQSGSQQSGQQQQQQQAKPQEKKASYPEMTQVNACLQSFNDKAEKLSVQELKDMTGLCNQLFKLMCTVLEFVPQLKKPTTQNIQLIQKAITPTMNKLKDFDRKPHVTPHAKAVSELMCAIFWVLMDYPAQSIQDQIECAEFYGLKIRQEKKQDVTDWYLDLHKVWVAMKAYVKENYESGVSWNFKGNTEVQGLLDAMAGVQQGGVENKEKSQSKVAQLKEQFEKPAQQQQQAPAKPEKKVKQPRKEKTNHWYIENCKDETITIKEGDIALHQAVICDNCEGCNIIIESKCKSIHFTNMKNCNLQFETVVAYVEATKCKKIKAQCMNTCPTFNADQCENVTLYLGNEPEKTQIITSFTDEMKILAKKGDEYDKQFTVALQFLTQYDVEKGFVTVAYDANK